MFTRERVFLPARRILLDRGDDSITTRKRMHQTLGRAVIRYRDRDVHVSGESGFRSNRHGKPADQRPLLATAVEVRSYLAQCCFNEVHSNR
jgi:hypothetical protein